MLVFQLGDSWAFCSYLKLDASCLYKRKNFNSVVLFLQFEYTQTNIIQSSQPFLLFSGKKLH